jgi:hypothetical protein
MAFTLGMKMYRIEDGEPVEQGITVGLPAKCPYPQVTIRVFKVVKVTPRGGWVQEVIYHYHWDRWALNNWAVTEQLFDEKKFILEGNGKRLCYQALELARQSYLRRKNIHIDKLEWRLKRAKFGRDTAAQNDFVSVVDRYLNGGE